MKAFFFMILLLSEMCMAATISVAEHIIDDPFMPKASTESAHYKKLEYPAREDYDFYRAIGLLQGICSSSFIKTSNDPSAPAYLLSAGHCVQDLDALADNSVVIDKPVEFSAAFNNFVDTQDDRILVNIDQIAYSTMKGMDISILRTDKTIGELQALNLQAFTLSRRVPVNGEGTVVAGMPNADPLMIDRCTVTGRVDLLEGIFHFNDFLENTCVLIGGMSGGPSFSAATDGQPTELVAVSSTGADERIWLGTPCHINKPCVGRPEGFVQANNHSYIVPVAGIQDCFDSQGLFQLSHAGCPLPTPTGLIIENHPVEITGASAASENQTWNFTPQHPSGGLKVKMIDVRGASDTCKSMTGYTPVVLPGFDPRLEQIPVHKEGIYQYCLLPADSPTATAVDVIMVKVDNTPSAVQPDVRVLPGTDNAVKIFYSYILNENSNFYSAYGPLDSFVCPVVGSGSYEIVAQMTFVDVPYPRVKVCSYLEDSALNKGVLYELDYPPDGAKK
ncbi:hypothetical protein AFK24_20855 [Pseudomonas syringae]|uniref:Trypsin n=1 Tax=Pseudomonas syringae TaxID=317 RepID=A0A1C7Z2B6_PSESX|nr:trypsin-like peptidase domain-containing protein [Pseudomonas syringae]OCR23147.1 hypothetical protein AFK24_20855 [Pseudomonas syringae]